MSIRLRGAARTPGAFDGVLTLRVLYEGSHSEHDGVVLHTDDDAFVHLYAVGDNPFENATFRDRVGARVHVSGVWRNGVLRVEPADILPLPPVQSDAKASDAQVADAHPAEPE